MYSLFMKLVSIKKVASFPFLRYFVKFEYNGVHPIFLFLLQ